MAKLSTVNIIHLLGHTTLAAGLLCAASVAQAGPYVPITPPYASAPTLDVPWGPERHPGKEYSDERDRNADGTLNNMQNIRWDGSGGVANTFNYAGSNVGIPSDGQVDALAHPNDYLFSNVVNNTTAILFSTRDLASYGNGVDLGAPNKGCAAGDPVCYETTGGQIGTWATKAQVNQHGVQNLDGLEVFGPEGSDDAYLFSLYGDPNNVSVWSYNPGAGTSTPYLSQAALAALFPSITSTLIDLDAMMVWDNGGNPEEFDNSDTILFSLWPIPGAGIVGDEVWVWQNGQAPVFLNHGGHLWNSGWLGYNIDALEAAAPEPATLVLLATGLLGMSLSRRRQVK